jgi:hypothetical protein
LLDALSSCEAGSTSLEYATAQNNRLMIRAQHWKFPIVLPMFRLSIIGA